MYPIDFMTCGADDVIRRSVICHPSLLADQLRERAKGHTAAYASMLTRDEYAAKIARGMADDCNTIATRLANGGTGEMTFGQRVIVFSLAARLQCLPHAVAQDILTREG